jgi:two-component system sensor kinase FixL
MVAAGACDCGLCARKSVNGIGKPENDGMAIPDGLATDPGIDNGADLLPLQPLTLQRWNRRLLLMPIFVMVLTLLALLFTLQGLNLFKPENTVLSLIVRQRALRVHYVSRLLLEGPQGKSEARRELEESQQILETLLKGGVLSRHLGVGHEVISPPPTDAARREILHRLSIQAELMEAGDRLVQQDPGSEAYQRTLHQMRNITHRLDNPTQALSVMYMEYARKRVNRLVLMDVLLVLLVGGSGLWLAFKQLRGERVLMESEDRFRQVFDASPIGKVLATLDGRWFKVNAALCVMLGYEESELLGQAGEAMTHPDDFREESPVRKRLLLGEMPSYQMTKRYLHKRGHMIWVLATVAVVRNSDGTPVYLVVQLVDMTEQRKTLEALRASEVKYRSVVESATDGILLGSMQSEIISANSQACHIFGYDVGEMNGLPITALMPVRYRDAHLAGMHRLEETGVPRLVGRILEVTGLRQDGKEFPLELSLSMWRDPQGDMFVTAIVRDVSERRHDEKEREALLQSNKDLEEFALIASHDMQEPLRKIVFYTERLVGKMQPWMDDDAKLDFSRVQDSARRMQLLITELLSYSRISLKPRTFMEVSLNQVLKEVMADLELRILEAQAELVIDDLPTIQGDETQLRQLFMNLLDNALKYRRSGVSLQVRIYGSLQEIQAGRELWAQIRVEDNGIGFNEKYLDRIFKVFQRLHGRGKFSGTGIGLATCRRIVERHRGTITAVSLPEVGSTFIVNLPVCQPSTDALGQDTGHSDEFSNQLKTYEYPNRR